MASRLQDVLLRGTAASRPAANTVPNGTLYYSTDTTTTDQSDGSTWSTYADSPAPTILYDSIYVIIEGGGIAITTGVKAYLSIPFGCTIISVTMLADVSGSIVVDIWKDTYANYPPLVADSIVASAKPTITTALKSQDTTLTGWNTTIVTGDVLAFNVDSATSITRLTLTLKVQR